MKGIFARVLYRMLSFICVFHVPNGSPINVHMTYCQLSEFWWLIWPNTCILVWKLWKIAPINHKLNSTRIERNIYGYIECQPNTIWSIKRHKKPTLIVAFLLLLLLLSPHHTWRSIAVRYLFKYSGFVVCFSFLLYLVSFYFVLLCCLFSLQFVFSECDCDLPLVQLF